MLKLVFNKFVKISISTMVILCFLLNSIVCTYSQTDENSNTETETPTETDTMDPTGTPAETDMTDPAGTPAETDTTDPTGTPAETDTTKPTGVPDATDTTNTPPVGTEAVESSATGNSVAVSIQSEAGILMEASTGTIIYEKEAQKQLAPASITKIMTLLLIFDALENKKISLDEMVTTSEYAASMGGSQVFLEAMEQQTVDTMIKCIAVASANDACVA